MAAGSVPAGVMTVVILDGTEGVGRGTTATPRALHKRYRTDPETRRQMRLLFEVAREHRSLSKNTFISSSGSDVGRP